MVLLLGRYLKVSDILFGELNLACVLRVWRERDNRTFFPNFFFLSTEDVEPAASDNDSDDDGEE